MFFPVGQKQSWGWEERLGAPSPRVPSTTARFQSHGNFSSWRLLRPITSIFPRHRASWISLRSNRWPSWLKSPNTFEHVWLFTGVHFPLGANGTFVRSTPCSKDRTFMSIHFLAGPGWMACRGGAVMTNARLSLGVRKSTCSLCTTLTGCIGTP